MIYLLLGALAATFMLAYRRAPSIAKGAAAPEFASLRPRTRPNGRFESAVGVVASFAVLFAVSALRRGPGTDYWARYVPMFQAVADGTHVSTDPGFLAINRLLTAVTSNYQWLFVLMSFATIGLVYRFTIRMSANPALSILIFVWGGFYLESFNLMRQWLAIAILLNTIEYVINRKLWSFLLLTVIAATFHSSALIWLVVWPLVRIRVGWGRRNAIMVGTAAVMLVFPALVQTQITRWFPEYAWYYASDYGTVRAFDPYGTAIVLVIFCASMYLLGRRGTAGPGTTGPYTTAVLSIQAVQIVALVAAIGLEYLFSRLTYYFTPIQMILVPWLAAQIKDPRLRTLATMIILALYAIGFYYKFMVWNSHGVLPYESVLD